MNKQPPPIHRPAMKNILPGLLLAPALVALALLLYLSPGPDRGAQLGETALLSLTNSLRRAGLSGQVALDAGPEGTRLLISDADGGCSTAYYVYQGQFYEHLYDPRTPFDPALGNPLAPAEGFSARLEKNLLTLRLSGPSGESSLRLHLRGREGGGQ